VSAPTVRSSTDADLEAITAIYAGNVLNGTGTFELEPPPLADMTTRRAGVLSLNLPWLVAEIDGAVVGYAYAGPFRPRAAYRYTVEDSIYVLGSAHGLGVGKALLAELIVQCEAAGVRQMLGVIGDSANEASIRLHTACGFRHMGMIEGVGWKFDRWLDVIFMQKTLGHGAVSDPGEDGIPLA
jgi:L-amino acid N-acyltransferase YncA